MIICGLTDRGLETKHGIRNVYTLARSARAHEGRLEELRRFAMVVKEHLKHPLSLETVLCKFYKNWKEHQRRHYRGRWAERLVCEVLKKHDYSAGKIKVKCEDGGREMEREIDCAIPPIKPPRGQPAVIIQVRYGVMKDLVKRAKEFSAEFDEILRCFPNHDKVKFVVVYFTPYKDQQTRRTILEKSLERGERQRKEV